MAKPTRAAVNHHRHLVAKQTECVRDPLVIHLRHVLQLRKVVAGPESAELRLATLQRTRRDDVGVRARQTAALFDMLEILVRAEAAPHCPPGALLEERPEILPR